MQKDMGFKGVIWPVTTLCSWIALHITWQVSYFCRCIHDNGAKGSDAAQYRNPEAVWLPAFLSSIFLWVRKNTAGWASKTTTILGAFLKGCSKALLASLKPSTFAFRRNRFLSWPYRSLWRWLIDGHWPNPVAIYVAIWTIQFIQAKQKVDVTRVTGGFVSGKKWSWNLIIL